MAPARRLPEELWLRVFGLLSWRDKLSVRCTCRFFRSLLDAAGPLWRGFGVVLRDLARYDRSFWRSLAQRRVRVASLRGGQRKDLKQLSTWLASLTALRLDGWREGSIQELRQFGQLQRLSVTSCSRPLMDLNFLSGLSHRLTQLSLCNVQLTCTASHLLASVAQLTSLSSLLLHHDGSLRTPALSSVLARLTGLRQLSWTMITYRTLSQDFFRPAHDESKHTAGGGAPLQLWELQLLDYDAAVTPDVLRPLSHLQSLSVYHLYSVPGPACHLQTWLSSLPQLRSLSVHGGHPLAAYADFLPSSLLSLTLCVDLQPDDLRVVSLRAPHLQYLHLEPWSSSSNLIRLLPQLFPNLQTLRISDWNDEALRDAFYQGLNESIKDELSTRDPPKDLADLETMASRIDQRMHERRLEKASDRLYPTTSLGVPSRLTMRSPLPKPPSFPSQDQPEPMQIGRSRLTPEEKEHRLKKGLCFYCGSEDHQLRQCPSKRHQRVSDEDFLCLQQLQHLKSLEVLDAFHWPDPNDQSLVVYEPSPRLLRLISDLEKLSNHRIQVISKSRRDYLTCSCV
ncbi:uncharacterized protein ACNS7B_000832 isoform 2-T2 [Menidia menidia]